jgi:predicted MFS family arabinose efflux permease
VGGIDIPGALTSTLGMGALVHGAIRAAGSGWGDPLTLAALGSGAAFLAVFARIEARAQHPIMPPRLFADAERVTAYAGRALFLGGMISFFFFLTLYLQDVLRFPPSLAGLAFLPAMLVNFAAALTVPRLTARLGNLPLLAIGLATAAIGLAWLGRATPASGFWLAIGLTSILVGAGQGLALSPLTASGIARLAPEDAGAASGVVNVAHQLGSSLGLGLASAFAATGAATLGGPEPMMHRFQWGLTAACAMVALAGLLVLRLTMSRQCLGPEAA